MSDLTAKQLKFVEEYLIDLNATQAAIRAGYSWQSVADFYVYFLINPISGSVFYVGKGCRNRAHSHLRRSGDTGNALKDIEIQKIRGLGQEPLVRYFASGLAEADALKIERQMILRFRDCELTNIANGNRSAAEIAKIEAIESLSRMRPYQEWVAGLSAEQHRWTVIIAGTPKGAYEKIRSAFEELVNRVPSEQWITMHAVR